MSNEGCWVQDFSPTELICASNHLTDFSGFVEAGYTPLLKSNYVAFTVIPTLSSGSLYSNTGFHITSIYFGSYLLFVLLGCCRERKKKEREELALVI